MGILIITDDYIQSGYPAELVLEVEKDLEGTQDVLMLTVSSRTPDVTQSILLDADSALELVNKINEWLGND